MYVIAIKKSEYTQKICSAKIIVHINIVMSSPRINILDCPLPNDIQQQV